MRRRRTPRCKRKGRNPRRSRRARSPHRLPRGLTYAKALGSIRASKTGRKGIRKLETIFGTKGVPSIRAMPGKKMVLVGMGISPVLHLADGPSRQKAKRVVHKRHKMILAANVRGTKLWIVRKGIPKKPKLRFVGWSPTTDYIAFKDQRSGRKGNKYWTHSHNDEGGRWPKVFQDQAGNYHYARGTYRVKGPWIHR